VATEDILFILKYETKDDLWKIQRY